MREASCFRGRVRREVGSKEAVEVGGGGGWIVCGGEMVKGGSEGV